MYIGRLRHQHSPYYSGYRKELEEKTLHTSKRLLLIGLPFLAYFLFQDFYIVKLPMLIYSRLIFLIPYAIYFYYLFAFKMKKVFYTELLHTIFWLSYLLMTVSMMAYVLSLEHGFGFNCRQVFNGYLVNIFLAFTFSGIGRRWNHYIIGVSSLILFTIISSYYSLSIEVLFAYSSNYLFLTVLLIMRSFQLEYLRFDEYVTKVRFQEKIIENEQLNSQLKDIALYDKLTSTITRNAGIGMLEIDLSRSLREGYELSVAFIDVDQLKIINDTYGHAVGDKLLKNITHAIKSSIRNSDYLIRMGGDEFLLVLPKCNEPAAQVIVQTALNSISFEDDPYTSRFSSGIVTYSKAQHRDVDELIKDADARMYHDKFNHRKSAEV